MEQSIATTNNVSPKEHLEEQKAEYDPKELIGWEFKIVRAKFPIFAETATVKRAERQERESGWVLIEKFDDRRLRFKRPIAERINDTKRKSNPYSTTYFELNKQAIFSIFLLVFGYSFAVSFFVWLFIILGTS